MDKWRRVEEIYFEALARPADERAPFVSARCAGEPDLEADVVSLLAARDGADDFLSHGGLVDEIAHLASDTEAPPADLGPYRILGRLGAGAMGEVFRARDTRLDRDVALKILPSLVRHHSARVARFQLEARATSALNHPNIVTVYEIGEIAGTWFIASELVDGLTLRDTLAHGPVPVERVIDIGIQCASALAAAHAAGIIHRDVKPENVMVRADGVVKVLDFGIVRVTEDRFGTSALATETGSVLGTPRYMSPEQARRQPLDLRTDVFSLGAVLFELKTGRPPFPGETAAEVFAELLQPLPRTEADREVDQLDVVIGRALSRDRDARQSSMAVLATELRAVVPGAPVDQGRARRLGRSSRTWPRWWRGAVAAGLLLAALLAAAAYHWRTTAEPTGSGSLVLVPLTTFEGTKDFAAFSPDGREIAFSWNGGSEGATGRHIYRKAVNGQPVPLTDGAADDTTPAWSPDGRRVAFIRDGTSVFTVPAAGGAATHVSDGVGPGVAWSPDGEALVLADQPPPKGTGGLFVLTVATGERRRLTSPEAATGDQYPVFSPDGSWVAFMREQQERDVFVVPSRGGPARRLTFDARPKLGAMTWTRDGRHLVYSTQREYGGAGLWRVPVAGGDSQRIADALMFAGNPSLAPDGRRLAYTETWIDSNIYESEVAAAADSGRALGTARRLIASTREDHSPAFSPDGQWIAFVSNRSGASEVWVSRRDGMQPTQLTRFGDFAGTPRWSPDGRRIAFDLLQGGNRDIWVVEADGGSSRRLTSAGESDAKPSWAPDGSWIYFSSRRSGREEIWRMRPDGREQGQVTRGGAREALPAPDGRSLYFTRGRPGAIWTVPAEGGAETPVPELAAFSSVGRAWGVYQAGLYFYWPDRARRVGTFRHFDFGTRQVTTIGEWVEDTGWTGPSVTMSPDGRSLLAVRVDQRINDLMMIENFR